MGNDASSFVDIVKSEIDHEGDISDPLHNIPIDKISDPKWKEYGFKFDENHIVYDSISLLDERQQLFVDAISPDGWSCRYLNVDQRHYFYLDKTNTPRIQVFAKRIHYDRLVVTNFLTEEESTKVKDEIMDNGQYTLYEPVVDKPTVSKKEYYDDDGKLVLDPYDAYNGKHQNYVTHYQCVIFTQNGDQYTNIKSDTEPYLAFYNCWHPIMLNRPIDQTDTSNYPNFRNIGKVIVDLSRKMDDD